MKEIITSIAVLCISVFAYVNSESFSMGGKDAWNLSRNAAVYPRLLAMIMFLLSIALFIKTIKNGSIKKIIIDRGPVSNVAKVAGLVLAYIIGVYFIGFIIATAAFLFAGILVYDGKMRSALTVPLPITLGLYLVFKIVFAVPLPAGELLELWR